MKFSIKKSALFLGLVFSAFSLFAQNGNLRGTVVDDDSGEKLSGVVVMILNPQQVAYTDMDGAYAFSLPSGSYSLMVQYPGYRKDTLTGISITAKNTTALNIRIYSSNSIKKAVVGATRKKTTEEAMNIMRSKSSVVMDGISAEGFKKAGDGNAAAAIKRVTGVAIDDGKYVYVRGLGDRYTKTVLNGMEIPGLDPDRNTVQMDIFPTSLIDNIVIYKTFSPNLSGDFTGGTISVVTKNFPTKKTMSLSGSFGFNPEMNFQSDFLSYKGAPGADALAFGGKSRALPISETINAQGILKSTDPQLAEDLTKSFSKEMAVQNKTSLMNSNLSFTLGNQINKVDKTYGYNVALGYQNKYTFYKNAQFNEFIKNEDKNVYELTETKPDFGNIGTQEVLWSGLINGSLKKGNNAFSATLFHTQNGIKKASELMYVNNDPSGDAGATLDRDVLYYNQRSITNVLLKSKFDFPKKKMNLTVSLSPSYSSNIEPDIRITAFAVEEDGGYSFNTGAGAKIDRLYRSLGEVNFNGKTDYEWEFKNWFKAKSKFQAGLAVNYKNRDFSVLKYTFVPDRDVYTLTGDPNQVFNEYLFKAETKEGYMVNGETIRSNSFQSNMTVMGAYAMNELPVTPKLKAVYGVRLENAVMRYNGVNQTKDELNNEVVLDDLNVLPSLNLIYTVKKKMNVRFSASNTIARPSFKEKSNAQIFDPVTGRTFIGNLDLVATDITNIDLRWEKFMKKGELVSISGFYKHFTNPIEIVAFSFEAPDNLTPRNAPQADVAGIELEAKKSLKFISKRLEDFKLGANFSAIYSSVTMTDAEYEARLNEQRVGETIDDRRTMQGQAPYLVNMFLGYGNANRNLDVQLSYNVQGRKLAVVGIGRVPDVYTSPFHSLNLKASKKFGQNKRWNGSVSINNILASQREMVYQSYQAQDQIYSLLNPGRIFSLGFSYNLEK